MTRTATTPTSYDLLKAPVGTTVTRTSPDGTVSTSWVRVTEAATFGVGTASGYRRVDGLGGLATSAHLSFELARLGGVVEMEGPA